MSASLVERAAGFLEARLSRRNLFTRTAMVGTTLTVEPVEYLLHPGSAYNALCTCGNPACGCGSTCCAGYTQFCCTLNGGYNWCPEGAVLGGWWMADSSVYCGGPRYYLDCNASCSCTSGCGGGWQFCDPGCDGLTCECALGDCDLYLTGCFQFRYGQCNQQVSCLGRIMCRVVSCVPPWQFEPTCTSTAATDNGTASQNAPCTTAVPAPPPPPPPTITGDPLPVTTVPGHEAVFSASAQNYTSVQWQWSLDGGAVFVDAPSTTSTLVVTASPALNGLVVRAVFADGPSTSTTATAVLTVKWAPAMVSTLSGAGYLIAGDDGGIFTFGDAGFHGSLGNLILNRPIVGMAPTKSGNGYWLVAADGGIFTFGDAGFHGSLGNLILNRPIVGMAPTKSGNGYWLVAADGGIFTFGDAGFHGSLGNLILNQPIVGMAPTKSGNGYWLVAADGGIFTFGDAGFHGSLGNLILNQPIVGMAPTKSGNGYWLVAADGGIFAMGDAHYDGSLGGQPLSSPIDAMAPTPSGSGYWLLGADGGIFTFGDAGYHGSVPGLGILP